MRSDIIQRVKEIIRHVTDSRRRLKHLEEETGIPDRNWKQVWSGKQRPTAHMIEALGRRWPQYAFWLTTGITDEANGHTAPPLAWTCGQPISPPEAEQNAQQYFDLKIYIQDFVYGASGAVLDNYVENKNPTEEELAKAKEQCESQNPDTQELLDAVFGKEVNLWKKKHTDLDFAIAQIAFDRRMEALRTQYPEVAIDAKGGVSDARDLLQEIAIRRAAKILK